LVEISANADPPVVKIIDWGKYNYQRTKQQQKNRRNVHATEMKQMRMGMKISDHDLGVKLRKVSSMLEDGNKVKVTLFFRGRENAHRDLGFQLADRIINELGEDNIAVDQKPQLAGRQLNFVIRSSGKQAKKENQPNA
jgi:translation initiation factor IF-3